MVGTNRSIDQQEVAFQNMCTWLLIPKYTESGVYLTFPFLCDHTNSSSTVERRVILTLKTFLGPVN